MYLARFKVEGPDVRTMADTVRSLIAERPHVVVDVGVDHVTVTAPRSDIAMLVDSVHFSTVVVEPLI